MARGEVCEWLRVPESAGERLVRLEERDAANQRRLEQLEKRADALIAEFGERLRIEDRIKHLEQAEDRRSADQTRAQDETKETRRWRVNTYIALSALGLTVIFSVLQLALH
jgi:hypothetical protein